MPVCLLLLILTAVPVWAAETEPGSWSERLAFSGWVETVQSARINDPDEQVTSRIGTRLEVGADLGPVYAFVSADAEKNWQIPSETKAELHEAWMEYVGSGWDLRLGRQIVIWGKADGVQITDLLSPPDYTESMTRNLDEIRMPVDALKLRLLNTWFDTELVWIPVFKAAVLPEGDNPWAMTQTIPDSLHIRSDATDKPESSLENSELALKVSAYLPGLDLAASVFHTWDDFATMHRSVSGHDDAVHVEYAPRHHRLTIFGLECSRPWSDFVFRAETAYTPGQYRETDAIFENPRKKDGLKWLTGLDWTPGNDWTVTTQLIGTHILGHDSGLADDAFSAMVTCNVSKKLLHQTLTVSNMVYWSLSLGDFFNRAKAEYLLTDALQLSAGLDLFGGPPGQFGRYEDNSQVWFRVKYTF